LCECKGGKAVIEAKMYLDVQHCLALKALLDLSGYKWALVSFHEPKGEAGKVLRYLQSAYPSRFFYASIVKEPSDALERLKDFCR